MKLPAGKRRSLRCRKKTSSGTSPGTETTVQPVRVWSLPDLKLLGGTEVGGLPEDGGGQ